MNIYAKNECNINGIILRPGVGNYDIDHKDPATADQLKILRKMKVIVFNEILAGDIDDVRGNQTTTKGAGQDRVGNNVGGEVSKQKPDESARRSDLAERRDGEDPSGKVHRGRRKKQ